MDVDRLFAEHQQAGRSVLTELHAKEILRAWGLPVPACAEAGSLAQAQAHANRMGYPVVLKAHSPAILHRSDVGGVKLNLGDGGAVSNAYAEIRAACAAVDPDVRILVQPMLPPGVEVIIGATQDPQFGTLLMFGLGGVTTELFKDVTFRLPPLDRAAAAAMVSSIEAYPLLDGFRGQPRTDLGAIADILVAVSLLVTRYPFIRELDLNPVLAYQHGAAVVDARMVIDLPRDTSPSVPTPSSSHRSSHGVPRTD
jgi:acyl-CoA synthetase (NDP forming)